MTIAEGGKAIKTLGDIRAEGRHRIAIVGFCNDSREWVPYEEPDLVVAGLNRGYIFQRRADAWFDMHGPAIYLNAQRRPGNHLGWLQQFPGPVYSHRPIEGVPNSVEYPLQKVATEIGSTIYRVDKDGKQTSAVDEPYLTSSIAQEIALAITEGYDEIHLYGIDLNTDSEYAWQKPGVEFVLGVAAGRGIKVVLPDNCPLLKGTIYGRGFLSPEGEKMSLEQLENRAKALEKERATVTQQMNELVGAKRELEFVQAQMVPGLDHEKLDERRHKMDEAIGQFQQRLMQIMGGMKETAYWIHQTPAGQQPKEAIAQLRQKEEGPVTDLDLMQTAEPVPLNGAALHPIMVEPSNGAAAVVDGMV